MLRRVAALVLVVLLLPLPASGDAGSEAGTPWWRASALDGDADGLDDALEELDGAEPVRALVNYARVPTAAEVDALAARGAHVIYLADVLPLIVVEAAPADLPRLAAAPGVVLVEADRTLRAHLDESRAAVGAEAVRRQQGLTGKGVTIAVFDTGIDPTHPDLRNRVIARYDGTRPVTVIGTLLGDRAPNTYDVEDGHGTHVAGIAAGPGTESSGRYAGVAPGAALVDVRVFEDDGDSKTSYVIAGIDWVLERKDNLRIRILQMSLGGDPTDGTDALSRAVNVAADRGLLTVASAGNEGPDERTIGTPGAAARALTVGAVDGSRRIADFSGRGPTVDGREKPDLVAPGVAITSAVPATSSGGRTYGEKSGTSMAAPHLAGVAALLYEANESLTPALTKWILVATTRNTGQNPGAWSPSHGWGFVDAVAAVDAARDPARLGAAPFVEKADRVPFDGPASPLAKLDYDAGRARRTLPVDGGLMVLAALVLGGVTLRRRARRAS